MAQLSSPGVSVTVIDESFYTPAAPGTTPLIIVASAQDKLNGAGTGIATGTLKANAGQVYLLTSQKDLSDTFGTPVFQTDASNNPVHAGELNEYGLQAAYSYLGVSNRVFAVRADIDLGQLNPSADAPYGTPADGTLWLDLTTSTFGIFEWDATKQVFVAKTPTIITDATKVTNDTPPKPKAYIGGIGDYAVVATSELLTIHVKDTSGAWVQVGSNDWLDTDKYLQISKHTQVPLFKDGEANEAVTGSVWIKTTEPNKGARFRVKKWNEATALWTEQPSPIYLNGQSAIYGLDKAGGGANLAPGAFYVKANGSEETDQLADYKLYGRTAVGATKITSAAVATQLTAGTNSFTIAQTSAGSEGFDSAITVSFTANHSSTDAATMATAINAANFPDVRADVNSSNQVVISHLKGGDLKIVDLLHTPIDKLFTVGSGNFYDDPAGAANTYLGTLWAPVTIAGGYYKISAKTPTATIPEDGKLWYNSLISEVDIMYHNGSTWVGYRHSSAFPLSDPLGPTVSATAPKFQQDGVTPLVDGDLWISTEDIENYPLIYRRKLAKWVLVDSSDQTTEEGVLFHDARWSTAGSSTEAGAIADLLLSNYVDFDAPDPALYPKGMLLWNLRRSGFNVKEWMMDYVNINVDNPRYDSTHSPNGQAWVSGESQSLYYPHRWVSVAANQENGAGTFGRKAQRKVVIQALQALVNANQQIRDEEARVFNLIATPGYPELIGEMISLNYDRGLTAFVVGDTPARLPADATSLNNWGTNQKAALEDNDNGLVSSDEYLGIFYPWGYTSDNLGNNVVVPPSHMILRTIALSDNVSYPWFAPAGTRRGGITNATAVGYVDATTGEFQSVALNTGQRDTLAGIKVNPITFITGTGLVNYGQYTRAKNASALDRINVARLIVYLRRQLSILAKPYVFEPNDKITRDEIKQAAESLMLELVGQRALYDYIVVCDTSNNTPSRIDRNELYLDIAIEPVKAVEFIYIPLRLKNTGEIKGLGA